MDRPGWITPGAIRVLLVAILFLAPVIFDRGAAKPFDYVKMAVVWVLAWLALGAWGVLILRGKERPQRFLMGWLAVAFLFATALATIFSRTPWISLFGWYGRYDGLLTTLVLVLVFFVVATIYRSQPDRLTELIWAMAAASMVMTLYVCLQQTGLDPITWSSQEDVRQFPFPFGTMGNSNFTGGYLGLTAPWVYFAFGRASSRRLRAAIVVAGLAQVAALVMTSARNGFVAFAAAGLTLLYLNRRRAPAWVRLGAFGAAVAAVLVAIAIIWHPGMKSPPAFADATPFLRSETIRLRAHWWMAGFKIFAERPVTGTGPETYGAQYHRHLTPAGAVAGQSGLADKPHNVFVEHLAETGVLGFAAFAALLVVAVRRGLRRLRTLDGDRQLALGTFLAILAGYMGQASFSIDVTAIAVTGWICLGAIAALADSGPAEGSMKALTAHRSPGAFAIALASLLIALVGVAPLISEHELRAGHDARIAFDSFTDVEAHYRRAISFHPFDPVYRGFRGAAHEIEARNYSDATDRLPLFREALSDFREMDRLQPNYHRWALTMGQSISRLATVGGAEFAEAETWFKRARFLAPVDWQVHQAYGEMLRLWGVATRQPERLCRALDAFERALSIQPRRQTRLALVTTYERLGDLGKAEALLVRLRLRFPNDEETKATLESIRFQQNQPDRAPVYRCD